VKKAVGESPFKGCSPQHPVKLTDAAGGGFVHPERRAAGREAEEGLLKPFTRPAAQTANRRGHEQKLRAGADRT
jgi:hypothetical protein